MKRDIAVKFLRPWGYPTEKDVLFYGVGVIGLVTVDEANKLLADGVCELVPRV